MKFQKGSKINLGRKHTEQSRRNMSLAHKGKYPNELHPGWKGDDVGYDGLHRWLRRHMPKPEACESCNEKKKLQAACVTGIYTRDFKNWKWLCPKCHVYLDGTVKNLIPDNRKRN